jgi:hypothetical protein
MITRNTTQALVAVIGIAGLVAATVVSFFLPDMGQERSMLVGGLIAATSTAAAWLFRLTENGNHKQDSKGK